VPEIVKVEEEVERICASAQFRKAPAQRELLRYLVEHRGDNVSEYAIGVEALGRKADFDPKTDSTARVQISRLRQRLKDYYEGEGKEARLRLHIPVGLYRVELREEAERSEVPLPRARSWGRWAIGLGVLALALLVDDLRLRWQMPVGGERLEAFWGPLVQEGVSVPLIVPAPLFFRWEKQPFVARDFGVNEAGRYRESPFLAPLAERYGPPQITQLYTVASDTVAASTLAQYLRERGVSARVIDTPGVSVDLIGRQNTIVFAGPGTTLQLGGLLEGMNFYLESGKGGVLNRRPKAGEAEFFRGEELAPLRSRGYGILARVPARGASTTSLLFLSTFNPALLSVLLTKSKLSELEAFQRREGGHKFFEIVIRYERNADLVLSADPVAYRPIPALSN
jgi:hypothetical protein